MMQITEKTRVMMTIATTMAMNMVFDEDVESEGNGRGRGEGVALGLRGNSAMSEILGEQVVGQRARALKMNPTMAT